MTRPARLAGFPRRPVQAPAARRTEAATFAAEAAERAGRPMQVVPPPRNRRGVEAATPNLDSGPFGRLL